MMDAVKGNIEQTLETLRTRLQVEFAALGLVDEQTKTVLWRHVSGNRNERYRRIKQGIYEGIAGQPIRHKQPFILNSFQLKRGQDPRRYAILLAEKLTSIIIVPLIKEERVTGAVLIGSRHTREFTEEDTKSVADFLPNIERCLAAQDNSNMLR